MSADPRRDAETLSAALERMGLRCDVEPRARLAVLIVSPSVGQRLGDAETRREVIAAARSHGFTHVAVELGETASGATVLRD